MVKALMGRELEGVPDINARLQLVHEMVVRAFAS
jgi:5,10-methylenetetrahydromethanopterin reductase